MEPERATKMRTLLDLLESSYGVNSLYTGFGSTKTGGGELGAREVMVAPNGTGLRLTPNNHTKVNIGSMTRADFDSLFKNASPHVQR